MKKLSWLFVLLIVIMTSCEGELDQNSTEAKAIKETVKKELFKQENCWNNGDIDCFMTSYWNNDSLMFVSGETVSFGWQKVTDNYKARYSSKELMGQLSFKVNKMDLLSKESLFVAGQWKLVNVNDEFKGEFTLLWKKIEEEWKIVIDHTS